MKKLIFLIIPCLLYFVSCETEDVDNQDNILGCTDPNAANFNPNASEDDGSCMYTDLGLIINEVLYDPPDGEDGDANGDGFRDPNQDEFIEFVNASNNSSIDLSGYMIYDSNNLETNTPRHLIPDGTVLGPGEVLVVFGGGSPVGEFGCVLVQTASSGALNMTNGSTTAGTPGDLMTIMDNNNNVIMTFDIDALSKNPNESYSRNPDLTGDFEQHTTISSFYFSPGLKNTGIKFGPYFDLDCDYLSPDDLIYGCTDSDAINYNPDANTDDGTCEYTGVGLIINEVLYDPPADLVGDANSDGIREANEDEFIEFVNISNSPIDLSNFKVYDNLFLESDNNEPRHLFSEGTIIYPGQCLVLFGGGSPTGDFGGAIVQTSSSGQINMTNSGDLVTIKNTLGETILTFDVSSLSNNPDESYTRNPDLTGDFVQHNSVNSLLFSPGTKINGEIFE